MASHRLPDEDRPRRAVPAWVTAPPESAPEVLEARPAPVASAPVPETVATASPAAQSAPALPDADVVVPDFPPQEDLLPPAPTSPAVETVPFETAPADRTPHGPPPVSPIDAAPPAPPTPAVPTVGQPRFSVPGLEHVVVEGAEPEPSGPIGYRTPARFARQQRSAAPVPAPQPDAATRPFDAVLAAGAPAAPAHPVPDPARRHPRAAATPTSDAETVGSVATPAPPADGTETPEAEPRLQDGTEVARRPLVGATPGAALGAVTGLAALGLGAWWFTAPTTVHAVGVLLGVLALLLSSATLRNPAATWQRPVALLGAVLGGVGTLVLLWAVASAVLPLVGVTLPDITGSGTAPTLAP
ncbi:hypothetical protein ACTJKO_12695 [Curtobacterium sp. 22159]|uniref:hypothetical protein n=1 Tax=Curtobacterium sp. 22159 TaxID=3453882 RepID=UPI003F869E60